MKAGVVASYLDPDLSMAAHAQDGHVWSLSCGSWSPVSPASLWEHGQHISTGHSFHLTRNSVQMTPGQHTFSVHTAAE